MSERVEIKWDDRAAKDKIQRVVEEALWLAGQDAITQSMPNVPLDTGTLRRSGTVTAGKLPDAKPTYDEAQAGRGNKGKTIGQEAPHTGGRLRDLVVYVSYSTPYAIWLHESPDWRPRGWRLTAKGRRVEKPAVGTWKWLEKALPTVKRRWSGYVSRAKRKAGL